MELRFQLGLNQFLCLRQRQSGYHDRPGFRQRDPALAIDGACQPLRVAAPDIEAKIVTGSKDILRSGRKVHWKLAEADNVRPEDIGAEAAKALAPVGKLGVQ